MNKYELLFIIDPDVDEEARVSFIERIKAIIQEDGEVEAVDEWGTRKLAYEIKRKTKDITSGLTLRLVPKCRRS